MSESNCFCDIFFEQTKRNKKYLKFAHPEFENKIAKEWQEFVFRNGYGMVLEQGSEF